MNNYGRLDLSLKQNIENLLDKELFNIQQLQHELNSTRGGRLYIKRTKDRCFFTEYSHGNERGIGHNRNRVIKLARRNYVSDLNKLLKEYISILENMSYHLQTNNAIESLTSKLQQYDKLNLDMTKILLSPHQQQWLAQPYERNPAYPEQLKFTTDNGVLMRTKSELIIANRLEHYGIPYLPEMPIWFNYDFRPKYPDFTILKQNGETIIWEHMGLMDKEDYFIKNSRKILEYRANGYSQNTNLIITFEEDISEPGIIDHIIHTRILS